MSYHIYYNDRKYTRLKILFSPEFTGAFFYKILELIEFPLSEKEDVLFRFTITELVTNAIRASKENNVEMNVRIELCRITVWGLIKACCPLKLMKLSAIPRYFRKNL